MENFTVLNCSRPYFSFIACLLLYWVVSAGILATNASEESIGSEISAKQSGSSQSTKLVAQREDQSYAVDLPANTTRKIKSHTESDLAIGKRNDVLSYTSSYNGISISYPSNWTTIENSDNVTFSSPPENDSDSFQEKLIIEASPTRNLPVDEVVSIQINDLKQNATNFRLLDSSRSNAITGSTEYEIKYSYGNNSDSLFEVLQRWISKGPKTYSIRYLAESQSFSHYEPTIEKMIDTLHIQGLSAPLHTKRVAELNISSDPYDIAVDPVTNKLYVTNPHFRTVSVVNGTTDRLINEVEVENLPTAVAVNPEMNKVYVANSASGTISVIDGSSLELIKNVQVGKGPTHIEIDPIEEGFDGLVFVANADSDDVSVIEATNDTVIDKIPVGREPSSMAVDPVINRLYVANTESDSVSVIDYFLGSGDMFSDKKVSRDIKVGKYPTNIILEPKTRERVYVANTESSTISVIDTSTLIPVEPKLSVGSNPYGIISHDNKLYVANYGSNTVSVMNPRNGSMITEIKVGSYPYVLSANPITDVIYVTNLGSSSVSEIRNDHLFGGITYNINPPNSGYLECNKKKISDNEYVRYDIRDKIVCKAYPGTNSDFESWDGDFRSVSNSLESNERTVNASGYGNTTANFRVLQALEIPEEFLQQLYGGIMIPVITSIIGGLFFPSIVRWLNAKRQRGYLKRCLTTINKIFETPSLTRENHLKRLEDLRRKTDELLTDGKISEEQYGIVNKKISEDEGKLQT